MIIHKMKIIFRDLFWNYPNLKNPKEFHPKVIQSDLF